MIRSAAMCQREGYPKERQQINDVTGVIDASNIYGSSKKESDSLRDTRSKANLVDVALFYSNPGYLCKISYFYQMPLLSKKSSRDFAFIKPLFYEEEK